MPTGRLSSTITVGGISMNSVVTKTDEGQIGQEVSFDAPDSGTLTTRTDDDTGVVTLSEGHGITTGTKVNVFWSGGERRGMDATVAGNAVTVDAGAGDVFPAQDTAVEVALVVQIDMDFDGDKLTMLGVMSETSNAHCVLLDDGALEALELDLVAGQAYTYYVDAAATTNPVAGDVIDDVYVSAAYGGSAGTCKLGVLYNSTNN